MSHQHTAAASAVERPWWVEQRNLLLAFLLFLALMIYKFAFSSTGIPVGVVIAVNIVAYYFAGWSVIKAAFQKGLQGDFFNEFVLMTVATLGAFAIQEYEEAVAVMLFYQIGEYFQDVAVSRAKDNIKALLAIRPDRVTVLRAGEALEVLPEEVAIGELIRVKAGEKVALDGRLKSPATTFNTAALTGESKPTTYQQDDQLWAGMINMVQVSDIEVTALFKDSKLSKILEMVQDATARKSPTQLFITRFSKIYVPVVFVLALLVCVIPFFFVADYVFRDWFYRALVFLVISCPCALVVSIPLGYFGGIGLASKSGILFKGGNFLDAITEVDTVVMDKTGTLTKGVFEVQEIVAENGDKNELLAYAKAIESLSTHPIALAISRMETADREVLTATTVREIPGKGLIGSVASKEVLAGNLALLDQHQISYPADLKSNPFAIVAVAIAGSYAGYITVADEVKEDAKAVIAGFRARGIRTVMLSGDKSAVASEVAASLNLDDWRGDLLPEDKVSYVQNLLDQGHRVAFAGDGVNDAPVVALATVGIAMGGLGADATIETADVVIQNDEPSKILSAIKIGTLTRQIVWQNIALAMTVKVLVLILGAGGLATLWEAVIADVGVALLAILNAIRIQRKVID